jgi:hypothetical protein
MAPAALPRIRNHWGNIVKRSWVLLSLILTGCVSGPSPEFINGEYYMTGGADCMNRAPHRTEKKIMCVDSKGHPTGLRYAMTPQQMQMYALQQQSSQQYAYTSNPVQVTQYPQTAMPQIVMPTLGGGNQVRCISTGIYTSCR